MYHKLLQWRFNGLHDTYIIVIQFECHIIYYLLFNFHQAILLIIYLRVNKARLLASAFWSDGADCRVDTHSVSLSPMPWHAALIKGSPESVDIFRLVRRERGRWGRTAEMEAALTPKRSANRKTNLVNIADQLISPLTVYIFIFPSLFSAIQPQICQVNKKCWCIQLFVSNWMAGDCAVSMIKGLPIKIGGYIEFSLFFIFFDEITVKPLELEAPI